MLWQPSASIETLKKRAEFSQKTRSFFEARGIMEVDVPILGRAPVTDPYLQALMTQCHGASNEILYLQTSPEYFMKRLLAAGVPSIYYLGKSFRDEEQGRLHSPEFTMLEWYHRGIDDHQLMQEVTDLLHLFLGPQAILKETYQALFEKYLQLNPHQASEAELAAAVDQHVGKVAGLSSMDRDTALQLLMSHVIEPQLDPQKITFIYDFPASQAALARIRNERAARFEVYYQGIELANGYYELKDAHTQRERFEKDLELRTFKKLKAVPADQKLLEALAYDFPDCAGVALGFDRLLMLALGAQDIAEVQAFGFKNL